MSKYLHMLSYFKEYCKKNKFKNKNVNKTLRLIKRNQALSLISTVLKFSALCVYMINKINPLSNKRKMFH